MQLGELFPVLVISCYLNSAPNERGMVRRELRLKLGNGREPSKLEGVNMTQTILLLGSERYKHLEEACR